MFQRIRNAASFFVLLALPMAAFPKECLVIPAVSVCSVPLAASQATFETSFGEPDGRINMGKDRVGLLYGVNFIAIFRNGRIWEIQNWTRPTTQDATHWLGYVGYGRADRETKVVFQKWNPWDLSAPREKVKAALSEIPAVTGDEYSDLRKIRGGSVFVLYGVQQIGDSSERSERVSYLQVSFSGEPIAP